MAWGGGIGPDTKSPPGSPCSGNLASPRYSNDGCEACRENGQSRADSHIKSRGKAFVTSRSDAANGAGLTNAGGNDRSGKIFSTSDRRNGSRDHTILLGSEATVPDNQHRSKLWQLMSFTSGSRANRRKRPSAMRSRASADAARDRNWPHG